MPQHLVASFTMTGKLEDLATKSDDYLKTLKLLTEHGEYQIKVAKEIRKKLSKKLQSGCSIKVMGMRKYKLKKGEFEYKAYDIEILSKPKVEKPVTQSTNSAVATKSKAKAKAKVLFCQKSTCWKKGGGAAVCEALKAQLQSKGIADRVEIKTVGCLKQCKKAPNLVVMPDKARYSKVKPKQMSGLIEEHLVVK